MTRQNTLHILSTPVDKGGCGWYRVRQPFEAINEYTDSDAHVIDKDTDDMLQVTQALTQADILVVRQGGESGITALKDATNDYALETGLKQGFHAKIVLDIDDNIELISPYSEHYGEYGTTDFYDTNAKQWIWKYGVTPNFDLMQNRTKVISFMHGLRQADLVTVTTEKLAEYARLFNPHVAVLPNAINTNAWWELPFEKNKQLRVGWSGGHSHYEDWYTIKEPLNALLRKYRFKLVMGGTGFVDLIDKDLHDLIETYSWVPFEAHSYRTMVARLDIALIPLADIPFNQYKSAIKWCEFSSLGIPSIVSHVTPYKEVVSDMTAATYATPKEFALQLERLLLYPEVRRGMGQLAKKEVLAHWSMKYLIKRYIDAYSAIL